jgi:trehalose 6-phosphate synthase/phosphatase
MAKTIIVSNRLPVKVMNENGSFTFKRSEGGLATGLGSVYKQGDNLWIGWPGIELNDDAQKTLVTQGLNDLNLIPVYLSKEEITQYYEGFSNEILWPVFHYMPPYANYDNKYWFYYIQVNRKFCEAILNYAEEDDVIWIHDYQLLLLPAMLRDAKLNITIGYFQHIPFPSFEIFRTLPWRNDLLEGMLGADLIGFHTYDDARHFLSASSRLLGLQTAFHSLLYKERNVVVESFPIGIDSDQYEKLVTDATTIKNLEQLQATFNNTKMVLSIDRLDYSKGIIQRLQAFELFLQNHPEYIEKVSLHMIVVPSRDSVPMYKDLKDNIDKIIGNINGQYRTNNWSPINYFYRSFPIEMLSALYSCADICLVTPLRDGMNLVCKEYIATRVNNDGVLILSEMAGASKELIDAIIVNPNNIVELSNAIYDALNMPEQDKMLRMKQMRSLVKKYNIHYWVNSFMQRIAEVKKQQKDFQLKHIGSFTQQYIRGQYRKARKRILFLDYDGTLVGFTNNINQAVPDKELYNLLDELIADEKNNVIIISGRSHENLEQWFGHLSIDLVAEHGIWHKKKGGEWVEMKGLTTEWKEDIAPILNTYTDRTPGSFIEEKSHSLVWHYRQSQKELGEIRSNELVNNLRYLIADMPLNVLTGNKVVEIKNIEANKGKAALNYLNTEKYDFIMAVGDDHTDEDLFKAIGNDGFTIKVNSTVSAARYYLSNYKEVRLFLKSLAPREIWMKMYNRIINSPIIKPFRQ